MNFVTYAELVRDARSLARRLDPETVGVLGIPRSGMLVASIIAQELDCHLGDVNAFAASGCTFMKPGRRMNWQRDPSGPIVVVDDSLYAGAAMDQAKLALRANPMMDAYYDYQFACLYLAPGMEHRVHYFERIVEPPRMFAWNWRHSDMLQWSMCDIDGVLCPDPTCAEEDADGYLDHLKNAPLLFTPRRRIHTIITGRLEQHRAVTEQWLSLRRIDYDRLYMAPFSTMEQRRAYTARRWKGETYASASTDVKLFIESDYQAADHIASIAKGRPVLCPIEGEVFCVSP